MRFEFVNALRDLDERMPDYFRDEIFAHASIAPAIEAAEALTTLDTDRRSARALRSMLRLIEKDNNTVQ